MWLPVLLLFAALPRAGEAPEDAFGLIGLDFDADNRLIPVAGTFGTCTNLTDCWGAVRNILSRPHVKWVALIPAEYRQKRQPRGSRAAGATQFPTTTADSPLL